MLYEVGPYQILSKIREKFGVISDEEGNPMEHKYTWTSCIWCFSIWVGLITCFVPEKVLRPFALSAMTLLIGRIMNGDSKNTDTPAT